VKQPQPPQPNPGSLIKPSKMQKDDLPNANNPYIDYTTGNIWDKQADGNLKYLGKYINGVFYPA